MKKKERKRLKKVAAKAERKVRAKAFARFEALRKDLAPGKKRRRATLEAGKKSGITDSIIARSKQKRRQAFGVWFDAAQPKPGVVPAEARTIAMDDAISDSIAWASQAFYNGASYEGTTFLGYPYLAELAQRPEYRRISEVIATEATRKWIEIKSTGDGDKSGRVKLIGAELDRLKAKDKFREISEQDGFFGRSHLYLEIGGDATTDDREELKSPIGNGRDEASKGKVSKTQRLTRLQTVEAVWCYPSTYDSNDPLKPNWYNPQTWFVQGKEIHASRLLSFVGREVPDLLKPAYSFGGLSMSQMAKPYVDNWLRTRQSVSDLISAFTVMIFKTNMAATLQLGADEFYKRMDLFTNLRDNRNSFVIDKNDEEVENISVPLGTLDVLQAQSQEHMASVSGIPIVKLLGIQPAGLNATAEGEIRVFYDNIGAYQEKFFREKLQRVIDFVQLSLFGDVDPEITFDFVPLWSLDEQALAQVQKTQADTDSVYIGDGVLSPEDARRTIASDKGSRYHGLNPDDLPEPPEDENEDPGETGGEPGDAAPPPKPKPGLKSPEVGKDAVLPFVLAGDADGGHFERPAADAWNEGDHPRDEGGKFSESPHHGPSGNFKKGGSGNLEKQGFQPRKRGSGSSYTESAQVAWHVAKETGQAQTIAPNNLGWFLLKKGEKLPYGHPHMVIEGDGTVTRYEADLGTPETETAQKPEASPKEQRAAPAAETPGGGKTDGSARGAFGGLYKTSGATPKENHDLTVAHVLGRPTNAGSSYRQMLEHLIREAPKHGGGKDVQALQKKAGEAYAAAAKKLTDLATAAPPEKAKEFLAKATKATQRAEQFGVEPPPDGGKPPEKAAPPKTITMTAPPARSSPPSKVGRAADGTLGDVRSPMLPTSSEWTGSGDASPELKKWRGAANRELLARGSQTGGEDLIGFDAAANKVKPLNIAERGERNVVPSEELFAEMRDPKNKIELHHNHPSDRSFSAADLNTTAGSPGVTRLYAHGSGGSVYAVSNVHPMIARMMDGPSQAVRRKLSPVLRIMPQDKSWLHQHAVMAGLHKGGAMDYEATLGQEGQKLVDDNRKLFDEMVDAAARITSKSVTTLEKVYPSKGWKPRR